MSATTAAKTYKAINPSERTNANQRSGTVRRDTARKVLENGWYEVCTCKGEYTDDYARDAARDYGKGEVSTDRILQKIDYRSVNVWVEENTETGEQTLVVFNNSWHYEVPLDGEKVRFEF